ncbi:unnamed protein product [Mycena citricolor]|uniref:Chitin-binding type-4 domain-containing protein n=1 Tax=Mycena citricolor TaxID=2018698 RepID=A0AAD2HSH8_9AGAR|nr:unnamed protein product [Mycena citricolor]
MVLIAASLLLLSALPHVLGHARVTTNPPIRAPGNAFLQKCGQASFKSVTGDPTGHIEEQEPVNAGCDLTLCRGMLLQDQPAGNVQQVNPSQAMSMQVDCTIPHGGPANVSLVDTTTGGSGQIIGGFLSTFDNFCPTSGPTPTDQTNLQYRLPDASTIGNKCQSPGDCVVQLFWATPDFSQNYYYCVDVVMAAAAQTTSSQIAAQPTAVVATAPAAQTTAAVVATAPAVQPSPVAVTTAAAVSSQPAAPATAANAQGGVSAAAAVPSKMVTVVSSAVAGTPATALGATVPIQSSAARRRARILWF